MAFVKVWSDDEFASSATNDVADGDLKVCYLPGHRYKLQIRRSGQWEDFIAHLDEEGHVPYASLPELGGGGPHTHPQSDITGLVAALAAKAAASHTHLQSDVTGLVSALGGKAGTDDPRFTDARPPTTHAHATADVTGLGAALAAKADTAHTHAQGDIVNLTADLAARQLTSAKGQANGYAGLGADGIVPASQLPPAAGSAWTTVKKTGDQSVTNNATLFDDAALRFAMLANTKYAIRGRIYFDTGATGDFKWRHVGPSSPALVRIRRQNILPGTTAWANIAVDTAYSAADIALAGTGTNGGYIEFEGIIQNGAAAGEFKFQWAQNTANGTPTVVRAGSHLEYAVI